MTPFQRCIAFCSFLVLITVGTNVSGAEETSPEEIPTFPPVVVTATQTEVPLRETAASVTLIDENTIEEKRLITVEEALREVPGLTVVQQGGPGATSSVFLRGTESNHTLVLIDGVPVNSPTTGAFDFADLTVENIERIEVIRGPQSTLYGSDALGGVIQIFTKKGEGPPSGFLSLEAGAYRTFREAAGLNGSTERVDYSLSASRFDTRGFSRANELAGNREDDGYENTAFSARLGTDLSEKTRLEWTGRYTNSESELDGCDPDTFFCPVDVRGLILDHRQWVTALGLTTAVREGWDQHLRVGFNKDDTTFDGSEIDTSRKWLDWRHDLRLGRRNLLTVGYEYESQNGKFGDGVDETTVNHAGYAFNQLRLLPLILNLGLRYDGNNRYGGETTYKIETAYLVEATATKLRAAYGTGFHGPTLNDLFFPGFGNPNLEPEKSESFETGIEQALWSERVQIAATYFQNRIEDLIVFVFDPTTFVGAPQNVAGAKITGWEFNISARPVERFALSASYTLMNTKDEETGDELVRRPRHQASGSLSIQPANPLRLVLQVRYVGKRFDVGNVEMDDYTVVNLSGTYALHRNVSLFARVENLFDREYEEVTGYGTAGFSGYGGVKVTF